MTALQTVFDFITAKPYLVNYRTWIGLGILIASFTANYFGVWPQGLIAYKDVFDFAIGVLTVKAAADHGNT